MGTRYIHAEGCLAPGPRPSIWKQLESVTSAKLLPSLLFSTHTHAHPRGLTSKLHFHARSFPRNRPFSPFSVIYFDSLLTLSSPAHTHYPHLLLESCVSSIPRFSMRHPRWESPTRVSYPPFFHGELLSLYNPAVWQPLCPTTSLSLSLPLTSCSSQFIPQASSTVLVCNIQVTYSVLLLQLLWIRKQVHELLQTSKTNKETEALQTGTRNKDLNTHGGWCCLLNKHRCDTLGGGGNQSYQKGGRVNTNKMWEETRLPKWNMKMQENWGWEVKPEGVCVCVCVLALRLSRPQVICHSQCCHGHLFHCTARERFMQNKERRFIPNRNCL